MNIRSTVFAIAAAVAAATAQAKTAAPAAAPSTFSDEEKAILRSLAEDVGKSLRESGISADTTVSALSFHGDRGRYFESLLKIAVTDAGLKYVEGRDDPMWDAIVSEIIWDERKNDVLDDATLTKFGRLQAARNLIYGYLSFSRDEDDDPRAELRIHISSVETKRHLWGRTFVKPDLCVVFRDGTSGTRAVEFPIVLTEAQLRVAVRSAAADGDASSKTLADAMGADARDTLAAANFAAFDAASAKDPEILVSIKSAAPAFDREDEYVSFSGKVKLVATVPADGNRILGETELRRDRAKRALGDDPALANLREDLDPRLRAWLGETVTAEKAGLRSVTIQVDFSNVKEPELEQRVTALVDAAAHLDGVRDARVVSRLPLPDGNPGIRITLRILFRPAEVPEGIATRLVAKRPDIFKKAVRKTAAAK